MRTFLVITLLFLALLGGGVYLKAFYQPSEAVIDTPRTVTTTEENTETPAATTPKETTAPTQVYETKPVTVATTPKPVEAVVPTVSCVQGGVCTEAEVATHHTRTDCYVSMSNLGKVYDVTDYVRNNSSVHPGGDIADYCGTDIFVSFSGQSGDHRHSGRAMKDLTQYEFATLK